MYLLFLYKSPVSCLLSLVKIWLTLPPLWNRNHPKVVVGTLKINNLFMKQCAKS